MTLSPSWALCFFFFFFFRVEIIPSYGKRGDTISVSFSFYLFTRKGEIVVKESQFQSRLIKKLKKIFPGCIVLKNDPEYIQGFPDLTIFYKDHWAVLECKQASDSHHQPNQDFYISTLDGMSFARFISPENEEEVLNDLQSAFGS